ncbi:ABC transporter ATP-binding protein [Agaribacterium haliotis]|uniref:ABC transporter ATP-binding protein n=1 Tax=Agaribacterium haliotis TaxID=2013869 RepID=UPI000BB55196|nr:ABC transporter ATP-binding protein [Agaribacterium haliotis]
MKLQADSLYLKRANKEVLRGISFSVAKGEVYALLGGNGAGKSSTLLCFLGFLQPTSGHLRVDQKELSEDLVTARKKIAYLPESASLYEHLNATENIRYFLELAGKQAQACAIDAALDQVSLATSARQQTLRNYSKGMRQKVAIALAILRDTEILLLDEPTSGLDPSAIDEFHTIVRNLADRGKTILMVSHDVYGACQVADKIGLLRDGVLVGEFSSADGQSIDTELVHQAFSNPQQQLSRSPTDRKQ